MAVFLRRALLSAGLAAAAPAMASEPLTDYVVLRAGVYLPQAGASTFHEGSYGAGPDLEIAVGRAFFPWLAGEIGGGYLTSESDVFVDYYPGQLPIPMKATFALVPVTASLKLVLPAGTIEPYAFGGAGVYFARFRKEPTGAIPPIDGSSTILGFHAGAGATWRASQRLLVGLDGRYTFARDEFFGNRYYFNGVGFTGTVAYRF